MSGRFSFLRQWVIAVLVMSLLLSSMFLPEASASPAEPETIPAPLFDPFSTGWASARNLDPAAYSTHYARMLRDGYMVIDIEVAEIDGQERISAVWQKNWDDRGWNDVRNLNSDQFHQAWQQYVDMGYRLIDQEAYMLNGSLVYAGVFMENVEGLNWASLRNMNSEEFTEQFNRYRDLGYMLIDIEAYQAGTAPLLWYSAVWVENTENLGWVAWRNLSSEEFSEKFQEYRDQYRMIDVESYMWGGVQYYAGIWVENVSGRGWIVWRDMSAKQYADRWLTLRDEGYRLINFEVYHTAGGLRYAGIWRQNGIRPVWEFKESIDAVVEAYQADNSVPGLSVGVYHLNRLVYLRGLGHADVDDDIIAHSRTIYRTASVAKGIAGVLGILLSEKGLLDLKKPSADYINNLPSHQAHTVEQTITNRSGVGHYSSHASLSDQYDTAYLAAADIWDTPLALPPPGSVYTYSTHAYTYLGASMEGAMGIPIKNVIVNHLTVPFNLSSLQAEDRSVPHPYRATLYNQQNQEVAADNISWKVLGGGMEVSAYDLVRLAAYLLNLEIFDQEALDTLWTRPDALRNYAYGWDVNSTHLGRAFVGKAGAQNGARSYVCIYPDDDLAISVLSNRRGHDTRSLCREIGAVILTGMAVPGAVSPEGRQLQFEELEEPGAEELLPGDIQWPQENPVAVPGPEDLMEPGDEPPADYVLHLPLVSR
jgi:CubicO group peptidase (beta-lactamase class C family)